MTNLASDTINRGDIDALISWLSQEKTPKLTKGELTWELERKWAKKIGTSYSVYVNSGSSALLLALAAYKQSGRIKSNTVVVPALSWATDVSSPMLLGMKPILCDCNLEDLSCDIDCLEQIFKTRNPDIFISVAPLGLVPDMSRLIALCKKYDVFILEDICESMGSQYQGQYLGSMGHASVFSMYFGHHISTIEGGFINTNDDDFYYLLLMMRSHGWDRDLPEKIQLQLRKKNNISDFDSLYRFYVPGMNLRATDLQAFIGLRSIDRLEDYCQRRNANFKKYRDRIKVNRLSIAEREGNFISNFAYPILHPKRDEIVKELQNAGKEVRPLVAGNIARHPFWFNVYGIEKHPNADYIDEQGFYLPNHQDLTDNEILTIAEIINRHE